MKNNKTTATTGKKNFWEDFRFEFVLYINNGKIKDGGNNIICQRLFDVKGYNKNVLKSLELKELMDNLIGVQVGPIGQMGIIPNHFKKLSKKFSWDQYNPYREYNNEEARNVFEYEDIFTFEIRVDKKTVATGQFSGNWFQTDVRYAVNIREIIPQIIEEINEFFSRKQYTTTYGGVDLKIGVPSHDFQA